MRFFAFVLVIGLLAAGAGLAAASLGWVPLAATTPHWAVTEWVLETAMEKGVARRAAALTPPDDLDDPARVRSGARAYDAMCATCHAAPGVAADALAEGLLPPPPELADEADEWSPAEIFWVTKHGIRMTGMAAFGPTHADRELWDVAAFVQRLPEMSEDEYRTLIEGSEGHDHGHGPSSHAPPPPSHEEPHGH